MELVSKCILSILAGTASHVMFYPATRSFGPRWGLLIRYAIGYVFCIPIRQLFLSDEKRIRENVFTSDLFTAMMYGAGVFIGHLTDRNDES